MPELLATFLDVGQGDSTIAVLPNGGGVVVDCPAGSAPTVVDYLNRAHVTNLELVVITHSDIDHAGGIIDVIRGFQRPTHRIALLLDRTLTANPQANKKYAIMLREIAELLRQGEITRWEPYKGNLIRFEDVVISVLHPSEADHLEALALRNQNECSVVLRIEYAGVRILLAADVQMRGWGWMVTSNTDLKADVFKFPHHGAWYNGAPSLDHILSLVDPSVVVISVGSKNGYRHPSIETFRLLRSLQPRVRFMCTQATTQCHRELETATTRIHEILPVESQGGHSFKGGGACPCAGNVTLRVSSSGRVNVSPTLSQHNHVIDLFDEPQCR